MEYPRKSRQSGEYLRVIALAAIAVLMFPSFGIAEITKAYATLHFKYLEAKADAAEPLEKLDVAYKKKLEELEAEATRNGDLERVSLIQREISTFKTKRTRATDQRLRAAQSQYERTHAELEKRQQSSMKALDRKYIGALEKLKLSETKAGQIESAKRIQKEIEKTRASLQAGTAVAASSSENRAETIQFSRFEKDTNLTVKKLGDAIELSSEKKSSVQWFRTRSKFSPPFKATAVAKTDSTNIRLMYGEKGIVIFNWELNRSELRIRDPASGAKFGVKGQGEVPLNKWVTLEFTVKPESITIAVDGKERHQYQGNYKDIDAELGIGQAYGSVVTLKSFSVEKL